MLAIFLSKRAISAYTLNSCQITLRYYSTQPGDIPTTLIISNNEYSNGSRIYVRNPSAGAVANNCKGGMIFQSVAAVPMQITQIIIAARGSPVN